MGMQGSPSRSLPMFLSREAEYSVGVTRRTCSCHVKILAGLVVTLECIAEPPQLVAFSLC